MFACLWNSLRATQRKGNSMAKKSVLITMHYVDNYGSVLQTYASQCILRKLGYDCEVLDYVRANNTLTYEAKEAYSRYRKLSGIFAFPPISALLVVRFILKKLKRKSIFDSFRRSHINLTRKYNGYNSLLENCPKADLYIVGSDQVWNNVYNGGFLPEYFLAFVPEESIKISLSSSIGIDALTDSELKQFKNYLQDFSFVSVREKSAAEQLSKAGVHQPFLALDPTLLLSAGEWKKSLEIENSVEKYVFVYQLNQSEEMISYACKLAAENECRLYVVSGHKFKKRTGVKKIAQPTVKQFVELIANARYVVTDSFHGTAFCVNFSKDYFVFYPPHYSTRLESILSLTKTLHRHVESENWRDVKPIDYEKVQNIISDEREKFFKVIKEALLPVS